MRALSLAQRPLRRPNPRKTKGMKKQPQGPDPSQLAKCKAAARELGTDDDPDRFRETIRKIAKAPHVRNADKPKKDD